ncbi:hypothetical protein N7492_007259 [Penicillium capsulatum]|uniref:3',5'-cyclic-nucleotide phosphodiesterase n=1 Tax=Penicillium capsulatum TaxID=69766 RepID=A0A9W9LKM8_9EURO|nr:hypothetical protein N7492_007259 [Penicillium capsulatum]KAJ6117097.1 hypothetical protein N7512_006822 [Penicillium capsulatum]
MSRSSSSRGKRAGNSEPVEPSFQIIVLGPTGGPREDSVTGILVRSTSLKWSPGSVIAVDAGTLLAGVIRLLKLHPPQTKNGVMNKGPFKGLELPHKTAEANAAYFFREIIGAVFITHPHLDHISGLAINTPILEAGNGPKPVAALPSVLSAIKNHLFNDVIWPNLSDEDGGAGLLTYQRLVEGGNPRFGSGDRRGYVQACNGLLAKCLSVSHGKCKQRYHPESGVHHRAASTAFATEPWMLPPRQLSVEHTEGFCSPVRSPHLGLGVPGHSQPMMAAVESSAFFLRDNSTGDEIIVFGDVEPDSVSLEPRNWRVWEAAAPKIAAGSLHAFFIECSYSDGIDDAYLYGHLCPRHLIAELKILADKVMNVREGTQSDRKRKLGSASFSEPASAEVSPRSKRPNRKSATSEPRSHPPSVDYSGGHVPLGESAGMEVFEAPDPSRWAHSDCLPLTGLSIYIIHIKETLTDGPPPGERILRELREHSVAASLGCQFFLPNPEEGIWA